jgi:hypothetical protein
MRCLWRSSDGVEPDSLRTLRLRIRLFTFESGECWCAKETFRFPMPLPPEAGDIRGCLCPSCLRLAAHALIVAGVGSVS